MLLDNRVQKEEYATLCLLLEVLPTLPSLLDYASSTSEQRRFQHARSCSVQDHSRRDEKLRRQIHTECCRLSAWQWCPETEPTRSLWDKQHCHLLLPLPVQRHASLPMRGTRPYYQPRRSQMRPIKGQVDAFRISIDNFGGVFGLRIASLRAAKSEKPCYK